MRSIPFLLALACWSALTGSVRLQDPAATSPEIEVLVVPIHGAIGVPTVALVNRAMREARSFGARKVILDLDTMGGLQDAMEEIEGILNVMREGRTQGSATPPGAIRVIAYVRKDAWSAGGYIALACDETYMAPGASLGAIVPVLAGPGGMQQIPDDDVRRKVYSALRARVRALVERREGVNASTLKIAEAMVDPAIRIVEVTYRDEGGLDKTQVMDSGELDGLVASGVRIINQREFEGDPPLTLTANEALRHGFSSGTYDTLDELIREEFVVSAGAVHRLEESWSESAVSWLESMKPLLFLLGFILLLVEAKVPGVVVPGVLGVVLIAIGLFSSYLVGLAEWTEILLFFIGLVMIGVELFLMPGVLIFGFLGFVSVVASLILSQQTFIIPGDETQQSIFIANLLNLLYLTVLVIVGAMVFYRFMPRIPFFNRALLLPPARSMTGDSTRFAGATAPKREELMGLVGTAATDLRPAGILEHGDRRIDVVSAGGFIERGKRLRVIEIDGNRIVVEVASDESGDVSIGLLFLLVIIGLCLIVAEVFFVSAGILSVGAAVSLISAIFMAFTQGGQALGFTVLAVAAIGAPLAIAFALRTLPKTPMGKRLLLGGSTMDVSGAAVEQGIHDLLDQDGVTVSALRPAGFARIAGRRVDVVTRGEMLESGTPVKVIRVDGNRVVVAESDATASQSS